MGAVLVAYPAVEAGGAIREVASTVASTEIAAPWWAKVWVGFLLIIIAAVLCWLVKAEMLPAFGHDAVVTLVLAVVMLVGAYVMLQGAGVFAT